MFFRYKINKDSLDIAKVRIYQRAKRTILNYPMKVNDYLIEDYLLKTYKIGLKKACYSILYYAKFNADSEVLTVSFPDKLIDRLANIITYGNRDFPGSNILQVAFGRL